jgi:hypothetical protein
VKHKQLLKNQSLKTSLLTKQTRVRLRRKPAVTGVATNVVVVSDIDQVEQDLVVVSDGEVHLLKKKMKVRKPVSTKENLRLKK